MTTGTYRNGNVILRIVDSGRYRYDRMTAQLSRQELPKDGTQLFRLESECGRYSLTCSIDDLMKLEPVAEVAS